METPNQVVEQTPTQTSASEKQEIMDRGSITDAPKTLEVVALFEDEVMPSVDELKGSDSDKPAEPKVDTKSSEPLEKPASVQPIEGTEKPEEKKEVPKEVPVDKPPPGYVPYGALHEERTARRTLEQKLKDAEARAENLQQVFDVAKTTQVPDDLKGFKVLSDQEFSQLNKDDPVEANMYTHKLLKYHDFQKKQAEAKNVLSAKATQKQAEYQGKRNAIFSAIAQDIPGIFDQGSDIPVQIGKFAVDHGFKNTQFLKALSDPGTMVICPGVFDNPTQLGDGAKDFYVLLNTLRTKTSDVGKTRDQIRADLEKELVPKITQELTEKFKKGGQAAFTSLDSVPSSGAEPRKGKMRNLSESEFSKLASEDQEKYLRGEI